MTQWALWAFDAIASLILPFAFRFRVKLQEFVNIVPLFQVNIVLLTLIINRLDNCTSYNLPNQVFILEVILALEYQERKLKCPAHSSVKTKQISSHFSKESFWSRSSVVEYLLRVMK